MQIIGYYYGQFIDNMRAEKNCSDLTAKSYWTDFYIFREFMLTKEIEELSQITTALLRQYVTYIKLEKGYSNSTVRRKIHSLSSFFKYLIDIEILDKNPMLPIHAPKNEQKIPVYFTHEQVKSFLEAPKKYARFPEHRLRDSVILNTLFYTGCRRSELLALNFDDIDFGRKIIKIKQGKSKKDRLIPMTEELTTILWDYLQERLPLSNNALILSDNGTRMSVSNLQTLFKRYLDKTGLGNKGLTIHKARHTFASLLLQNSCDLISIKDMLGHADLNSTKIYTHTTTEHLKQQVDKLKF